MRTSSCPEVGSLIYDYTLILIKKQCILCRRHSGVQADGDAVLHPLCKNDDFLLRSLYDKLDMNNRENSRKQGVRTDMDRIYSMDRYDVKPIFLHGGGDFLLDTAAPGSKSITNRALMLAALADGESTLEGVLFSDDSRHFLQCLEDLGFALEIDEAACRVKVTGCGGRIPRDGVSIDVGSAGTCARFLTAMLGLSRGRWHLDASPQMKRRPMAPLLNTLISLGCAVTYDEKEGFFPFTLTGAGISSAETTVDIGDSSQFLSALLMAGVLADHDFTIHITGDHGLSYIRMTMQMMRQFGAEVRTQDGRSYRIAGRSRYSARRYQIEPDMSAAAYFYGMAAISGGSTLVRHIHRDSLQGDIRLLDTLEAMGCRVEETPEGIRLTGPAGGRLHGMTIDMGSFSDQALTIAALAPFADGDVRICNVGHIRLQECDRMAAIVSNLARMGITAGMTDSDILIHPGQPQPAEVETYNDHRVAMAFSLTGLKAPGITILDPLCCRKTFEDYFERLEDICADYEGQR